MPGPSDVAVIPVLAPTSVVYINTDKENQVGGLTLDASVTLNVMSGSLAFTADSSSSFGGNAIISDAGTMNFAEGSLLTIAGGKSLSVRGSLNLDDRSAVFFGPDPSLQTRIVVSGSMTATGTSFFTTPDNRASLALSTTGRLVARDCSFSLDRVVLNTNDLREGDLTGNNFADTTVVVPYRWIGLLADNASFHDIAINQGTIFSGRLDLGPLGTDTSNLRFVFEGGFTVGSRATLGMTSEVKVLIPGGKTLRIDGTLDVSAGAQIQLDTESQQPSEIVVNGKMIAQESSFMDPYGEASVIRVNSGGTFEAHASEFSIGRLMLGPGSIATMDGNHLGDAGTTTRLEIDSSTTANITSNDFSNVGSDGIIVSGDPSGRILLTRNYWGTIDPREIDGMILDHRDDSDRPTLEYLPIIIGPTSTVTSPASAFFRSQAQTMTLTASVTAALGGTVNEGLLRFSIWNGEEQLGLYTGWVSVSNGVASAPFTLPGGTPAGMYSIHAEYSGSESYFRSADESGWLTVSAASTVVSTAPVRLHFDATTDQAITLSTQVSSLAGIVGDGTVTFTVLADGVPLGDPIDTSVVGGTASAVYALAAGTPGGSYTILTSYSDPTGNFESSESTASLEVIAAATIVHGSDLQTTFSAHSGRTINLEASVSSQAGLIDEGTITIVILDGSVQVTSPVELQVIGGQATGDLVLPAGTAAKTYTVQTIFNGTTNYAGTAPAENLLTVSPATTTTTASERATVYSVEDQILVLSTSILSEGLDVMDGTVTFTVLEDGAPVDVKSSTVVSGQAAVRFPIPGRTRAGTYEILASYVSSTGNYSSSSGEASLTVQRAVPTITWEAPDPITFGTPLSSIQLAAAASVPGSFRYSPGRGAILPAGYGQALKVTFTPTDAVNYATAGAEVPIDVAPAAPRFAGLSASQSITYGTTSILVSGKLADGAAVPRGQTVTVAAGGSTATAAVLADGSFTALLDTSRLDASASPYAILLSYAGDGNFEAAADSSTTLKVNRAVPTITWDAPDPISHSTPLSSVQLDAAAPVPGIYRYSPRPGALLSAGEGRVLKVMFTPTDTVNYTTAEAQVAIDVDPAVPIFANLSASQSIAYGTPSILVSGMLADGAAVPRGQTVTVTAGGSTATAVVLADGSFSTQLQAGQLSASTSAYRILYSYAGDANFDTAFDGSTTLTVDRAVPAITWDTPGPINRATPLSSIQLAAAASVPGSFRYTPGLGTMLPAGKGQALKVTFTPADAVNYTTAEAEVPIDVAPAVPRFAGLSASQAITYGTTSILVSGKLADGAAIPRGQSVTVTAGGSTATAEVLADGSFTALLDTSRLDAAASPYTILFSSAGDGNFEAAMDGSTSLTVNPAKLNVVASNATVPYGSQATALSYSASGFVNNDPATILTGSPNVSAGPASVPGVYPITQGSLWAGSNYIIVFTPGALTIEPLPVSVIEIDMRGSRTGRVNAISITFDGELDRSSALTLSNYRLTAAGRSIRRGTPTSLPIPVQAVDYKWNGSAATVTLTPRRPFMSARRVQLVISDLVTRDGENVASYKEETSGVETVRMKNQAIRLRRILRRQS